MRATYLEICGFRSFGTSPQRLDFDGTLTVIAADNSQGKTSLAESVEFLFSGATTRRLLLGGSPSEFEDSLRNAHLSPTAPVYVEMGFDDSAGNALVARRELTCDYRGASDCTSLLTIDGLECTSIVSAGLPLSDPPLAAPVLLEHTLRYAVSAKPGERSDYFKALLEVADLDVVRDEVAAIIAERESAPRHQLLAGLRRVASVPLFSEPIDAIRRTTEASVVEHSLRGACHAAAPPSESSDESLAAAAIRLRSALNARQLNVLPVMDLASVAPPTPDFGQSGEGLVADDEKASVVVTIDDFVAIAQDYGRRVIAVDAATAEALPLLRVALQTDRIAAVDQAHPVDCPLCLASGTLTADRVAAIRAEIAEQQHLSTAASRLNLRLQQLRAASEAIERSCHLAEPNALRWTDDLRRAHSETAHRLGAELGQFDRLLSDLDTLRSERETIGGLRAELGDKLEVLAGTVQRLQGITDEQIDAIAASVRVVHDGALSFATVHSRVSAKVSGLLEVIQPALESGTDTAGWSTLLELTDEVPAIVEALTNHRGRTHALNRLRFAAKELETASQAVLDQRLADMGGEVGRWWELLRPDELTGFGGITRKGTGKRYLDVTAALAPQPAAPGVVRNALAVFSNSQLNALGLSTFLARCTLLDAPLVLLDDPVPGSDREHRSTFASGVVGALLEDGRQVIVTTHDSELARHLHASHQHLGVSEFEAVLTDPRQGTQVVRTGDAFERLMLDASSQMYSPLRNNRRAAGNSLRIAAERLAKLVVVAGLRRGGDAVASISDYDGKNLRDLRPSATQYALRDNEPGQWSLLARTLNDADHDTLDPPLPADLKNCHSTLRQLKRQHVANDPDLMKA